MKVVRLKKGYHISLSDSEYALLDSLIGQVELSDPDEAAQCLSPAEKAAWTRRQQVSPGFLLGVDEDRRHGS